MGQKCNPRGLRLFLTKDWSSKWYAKKNLFATFLKQDNDIRRFIIDKYSKSAVIARALIKRTAKNIDVTILAARPGVLIGKKGEGIENLKKELQQFASVTLHVNVEEVRKPDLNATIIAKQVAMQIKKRITFRRAMKKLIQAALKAGALGIKIECSGRLNGAEIARTEWYREGRAPLHTLRANVDYDVAEALTTYGIIGVKVWVYTGDLLVKATAITNHHSVEKQDAEDKKRSKNVRSKPFPSKKRKIEVKDATA